MNIIKVSEIKKSLTKNTNYRNDERDGLQMVGLFWSRSGES